MYYKDFDSWNRVKKRINSERRRRPYVRVGEIRWAALGVNIGSEIDGKGGSFTRPVIVVHVFGRHLALVVPLSTKLKELDGYVPFEWKHERLSMCVHQTKVVSQKRLLRRRGHLSKSRLDAVRSKIRGFFRLN